MSPPQPRFYTFHRIGLILWSGTQCIHAKAMRPHVSQVVAYVDSSNSGNLRFWKRMQAGRVRLMANKAIPVR